MLADLSILCQRRGKRKRTYFFYFFFFTFTRKKKASTNDLCISIPLVSIELTNIRGCNIRYFHLNRYFSRYPLTRAFTFKKKKVWPRIFVNPLSSTIPNNPLSKVRTEWWCESSKAPWFLLYIYIIYVYNIYV